MTKNQIKARTAVAQPKYARLTRVQRRYVECIQKGAEIIVAYFTNGWISHPTCCVGLTDFVLVNRPDGESLSDWGTHLVCRLYARDRWLGRDITGCPPDELGSPADAWRREARRIVLNPCVWSAIVKAANRFYDTGSLNVLEAENIIAATLKGRREHRDFARKFSASRANASGASARSAPKVTVTRKAGEAATPASSRLA